MSVELTVDPGGTFKLVGFKVQLEFAGAPVQVSATVAVNFACGFSVIVEVPDDPGATLIVVGDAEIAKFGPEPVSVTVCEPPVALSLMFIVAVSGPSWLGVRSTLTVQLVSGETVYGDEDPHVVLVTLKSALFAPLKVKFATVKSSPPELLNVVV